ncbi:MAG TPA: TadE family protein [Acidimicrobiales bacterium]|nr:TadE family protein [Acidimicrobiales bacterium]
MRLPRQQCSRRGHTDHELGGATAELVVVLPALFALICLFVQIAMWAIASHAVQEAASTGGGVARDSNGGAAAGVASARSELAEIAGGLVVSPTVVAAVLPGGQESITVAGSIPSILPGVHLTVSSTNVGPIQAFRSGG